MGVRLRQIALVGQDIDWSVTTLTALFDTYVAFRDPGIVPAFGGMFNALLAIGDCFLEIVSPTDGGYEKSSTTAKLLKKSGGWTAAVMKARKELGITGFCIVNRGA